MLIWAHGPHQAGMPTVIALGDCSTSHWSVQSSAPSTNSPHLPLRNCSKAKSLVFCDGFSSGQMRYPCAQCATAGPDVLWEVHSCPSSSSCTALPQAMSHRQEA